MQSPRPDPAAGVFETLLVRDGRVQAPEAHVERLARSVAELYSLGLPRDLLRTIHERAAGLDGVHRLRVDAVPEAGTLRIELLDSPVSAGAPEPVACSVVEVPGGLGSHKWRDRRLIDSWSAAGCVPLLADDTGEVLEAAWANVWLIEAGRLITPPADGRILPGVTRALLIVLAPKLHLEVRVEPVSVQRLRAAPVVFLTSSVRLVVPAGVDGPPETVPAGLTAIRTTLGASSWA